jgi:hypothetical protein
MMEAGASPSANACDNDDAADEATLAVAGAAGSGRYPC